MFSSKTFGVTQNWEVHSIKNSKGPKLRSIENESRRITELSSVTQDGVISHLVVRRVSPLLNEPINSLGLRVDVGYFEKEVSKTKLWRHKEGKNIKVNNVRNIKIKNSKMFQDSTRKDLKNRKYGDSRIHCRKRRDVSMTILEKEDF